MNAKIWKEKGRYIQILDYELFVIDEGAKSLPVLCILHGFPSCSYDYWRVLSQLSKHFRVIIHDHIGFGYSSKSIDYSYSLIDQADIALLLWKKLGLKRLHILAHDYGTSVACEIISKWNFGFRNLEILSVTIGNGSMLIEMADLMLSQKLLMNKFTGSILTKLSNLSYFNYNMKKLWADSSKYEKNDIAELYEIGFTKEAKKVFPKLSRYNLERVKYYRRWIHNGLYATDLKIGIFWADKDPIAVVKMAHEIYKNTKNSQLKILSNVGHYPMLEAPKKWTEVILELIQK